MVDVYKAPFGTYTLNGGVLDATAKTAMTLNFTNLKALFQPASGGSAAHPDFNKIPQSTAKQIVDEIDALAAITIA